MIGYIFLLPTASQGAYVLNITKKYLYCSGSNYAQNQNQSYFAQINSSGIGKWQRTVGFPLPVDQNVSFHYASCSIYGNYTYCVGNARSNIGHSTYYSEENITYYAPVSDNGIGQWMVTSSYPLPFISAGCSAYDGYLYCIGTSGYQPNGDNDAPFALYAQISGSGIGNWMITNPYPLPIFDAGCSIYNGYIYCVGNADRRNAAGIHNLTYYAQVSPSGIGQWNKTTSYPVSMYNAGCSIYNGYIYCVGTQGTDSRNESYFAKVNDSGIGKWTATTPYPIGLYGAGCEISGGYIYCVGTQATISRNQSYFAQVNSSGIGNWVQTTPYPVQFYNQYCQVSGYGGGYLGGGGPSSGPFGSVSGTQITSASQLNLSMLFRDPT